MKLFSGYLLLINLIGFFIFFLDKQKAIRNQWRIPESRLFLLACLGGGIGCYLGMKTFRHKTRHLSFVIGIPLITIIEYAVGTAIYLSFFG